MEIDSNYSNNGDREEDKVSAFLYLFKSFI